MGGKFTISMLSNEILLYYNIYIYIYILKNVPYIDTNILKQTIMHLHVFKTFYMLFKSSHLFHVQYDLKIFLLTANRFYIYLFSIITARQSRDIGIDGPLGGVYELVYLMIVEISATWLLIDINYCPDNSSDRVFNLCGCDFRELIFQSFGVFEFGYDCYLLSNFHAVFGTLKIYPPGREPFQIIFIV